MFNFNFHSVGNSSTDTIDIDDLPEIVNSLDHIMVYEADIYKPLISLDPNKDSGLDNTGLMILVSCASTLYKSLHHLFKTSLKYGVVLEQWHIVI